MKLDHRALARDLQDGYAQFMHQLMYPEMTADYHEKLELRMGTDPLLRARVDCLVANTMKILEQHCETE